MYEANHSDGQVLIIILLVMIVGLTVGLFLIGRTTTDISLSTKMEQSTRAFNAAETGIEETIRAGTTTGTPLPLPSGVSYQVATNPISPPAGVIYPDTASKTKQTKLGDVFTVWLVPHDPATNALIEDGNLAYKQSTIEVCYGDNTPHPAIWVMVIYKDTTTEYKSSFTGYDNLSFGRISGATGNKFRSIAGTTGDCGVNDYTFRAVVNLQTDFSVNLTQAGSTFVPIALRIRPVYAASSIGVIPQGGVSLPTQGNQIESTGQAGETQRKIQVAERFVMPAPFLDYALYSAGGADLTK